MHKSERRQKAGEIVPQDGNQSPRSLSFPSLIGAEKSSNDYSQELPSLNWKAWEKTSTSQPKTEGDFLPTAITDAEQTSEGQRIYTVLWLKHKS